MNLRGRKAWLGFIAFAALCSCAPSEDVSGEALGQGRSAIVGGTVTSGDPEVFMLSLLYSNGSQSKCTATLINRRTLITAAHCVDPRVANATSVDIWATNATYASTAAATDALHVSSTALHPSWDPAKGTLDHDLALLLLDTIPTSTIGKPWNTSSVSGFIGRPLRAVGFGTTGPSAPDSSGVKREVALTFRNVDADHIYLGDLSGKGICHGDSGGPSFHTFADGVERLVGVHSYTTSEACTDGADVRVDAYSAWINSFITAQEGPACGKDGACVEGCEPIDQDCVCGADSVCSVECVNPLDDPDCPQNCGHDGICQPAGCALQDDDCLEDGDACTGAQVCPGKRCLTDAQHDALYCSRSCAVDDDCATGMTCQSGACRFIPLPNVAPNALCVPGETYCIGRLTCAGVEGEPTRCVASCELDSHCPRNIPCVDSAYGRFCKVPEPTPVLLPVASAEAPVAASCAAVPGALPLLALISAIWLRRRRRPSTWLRTGNSSADHPTM